LIKEEKEFKIKTVGCYTRLSQEDRKTTLEERDRSLRNQKEMLEYFCRENSWEPFLFDEGFFTGADRERKQFNEMLKQLEEGKIQAIVVTHQSRLGRDAGYIIDFLKLWNARNIPIFDVVGRNLAEDFTMGGFQAVMDDYTIALGRLKQKQMMKRKVREGKPFGKSPYGYTNNKKTKSWDVVPQEAENVRRVFLLALNFKSYGEIASLVKLPKTTVWKMLRDKKYTGLFVFNERFYGVKKKAEREEKKEYKADYEPVVSLETWTKVQGVLNHGVL